MLGFKATCRPFMRPPDTTSPPTDSRYVYYSLADPLLPLKQAMALIDKMLFAFPDFMASNDGKTGRPLAVQVSQSFPKLEAGIPESPPRTSRASTVKNGAVSTAMMDKTNVPKEARSKHDVFERSSEDAVENGFSAETNGKLPIDFDELPIELVGLADR